MGERFRVPASVGVVFEADVRLPSPTQWVVREFQSDASVGPFPSEAKAQAWVDAVHELTEVDPDVDFDGVWMVEALHRPTHMRRVIDQAERRRRAFRW